MDVTAVIPLYDGEPFLTEALASLAAQSPGLSEVVVVDDGSHDDGPRVAQEFGALLIRQQNKGVSAARNMGVRAAKTTWIAFIDQDDVWHPEKQRLQCEALSRVPEAGFSYTDFWRFAGTETTQSTFLGGVGKTHYDAVARRAVGEAASVCTGADFARAFASGLFFFPSGLMIRRDLALEAGLFDETLRYWGDYEFIPRVLGRDEGPVVIVERPLVGHRDHAANASQDDRKMLTEPVVLIDAMLARPGLYAPEALEVARDQLPDHLRALGKKLLYDGEGAAAAAYLGRAQHDDPSIATALLAGAARVLGALGMPGYPAARRAWDASRHLRGLARRGIASSARRSPPG